MRIYHNIPALTAYNSLNSTNAAMEKSIQKLSTGLRINSAADDAAGFAISEKMRSQINGLEIAIRNTQDATSMLQTAEGALGETNSMLQRMRELAVQASNDTLTSQDRSYIQLEIDQLQDQIDRIAKTTQFNKKRLLDGSSAGVTSSSNLSVKAFVRGSLREIDQFGQKKSFEGNYKIKINVDPSQTGQGQVQKSSIMTIKHPNVITDLEKNAEDGIVKVEVDNLPAANFNLSANTKAPTEAKWEISSVYGFDGTADNPTAGSTVASFFSAEFNAAAPAMPITADEYTALATDDQAIYEASKYSDYTETATITADQYAALDATLQANYTRDTTDTSKYNFTGTASTLTAEDYEALSDDMKALYEGKTPSEYKLKDGVTSTEYNALSDDTKKALTVDKYTQSSPITADQYTALAGSPMQDMYELLSGATTYTLKSGVTAANIDAEAYEALSDAEKAVFEVASDATITPNTTGMYDINNASILFEISSVSDESVTLKAQSNILTLDGNVDSAVVEDIILKFDSSGSATTFDLSKLLGVKTEGAKAFNVSLSSAVLNSDGKFDSSKFSRGDKFVMNVSGYNYLTTDKAGDMSVEVSATQDPDWQYNWANNKAGTSVFNDGGDDTISYNLTSSSCLDKEIHFRNYYLDTQRGTVYDGDVILTTDKQFTATDMNNGDILAKFTSAYIGKTATGDTKLRDLNTFWNTSGVFMLDNPQTITITQGDGKSTSVTLYATDTLDELRYKFNDAIANGLGQSQFVDGAYADNFCTFVEKTQGVDMPTQGLETVPGTFIFRSLLTGSAGDLTFSGDEDLINKFAMNVVKESSTAAFQASIYDAHTGIPIATNVKVADNHLIGILHDNVDIEFDAMAGIKATWSETEKNFILTPTDTNYEATIHIVDSSTVFQIGANEGEDIAIDIGNMSAASLGVTNINVATRETASAAIGIIDAAINKVSTQRAKIGAYQNALEYTSENLTTTMTNLSAAESRIRDADMAQEMMNFVKLQILNQSGTSMLAQANQLPQSVLSLLQ